MRESHYYNPNLVKEGNPWCTECKTYHFPARKPPKSGNSFFNNLGSIRKYVIALMVKQGRDLTTCELCGSPITKRILFHHEKYEGATFYDLKIVCDSCNQKSENKLLI